MFTARSKIKPIHILIVIILLAMGFFLYLFISSRLIESENTYPNMAVDSQGNLQVVWLSGKYLYYKKIDSEGNPLINAIKLVEIERRFDGPEIVTDSENNAHIFTGIEISDPDKHGMIVQYLIVENGIVSFKREIKNGDETRGPLIAIDKEDNIYLMYSVWNDIRDNKGLHSDWDIRHYLEKLNSKGEILSGPIEIEGLKFPEAYEVEIPPYNGIYGTKMIIHNDKLYLAVGLTYRKEVQGKNNIERKYKYAEISKEGKLLRILDSPINYYVDRNYGFYEAELLSVLTESPSYLCFNFDCTVDKDNNVYYFYPTIEDLFHGKCYLQYKKFDQLGRAIGGGKITEFNEGSDSVIFPVRSYIDKKDNSNIIYFINDGHNNFSIFYSKISSDGGILIEKIKIR